MKIDKTVKSFSANPAPKGSPPPRQPDQAEIETNLVGLRENPLFKNDISQVIKFALGDSGKDNPVIQAALKHPQRESVIRECAAYAGAWRQTNKAVIAIVNTSHDGEPDSLGERNYEVRICGRDSYETVCSFKHKRGDGLAQCLFAAFKAVERQKWERVQKIMDEADATEIDGLL